MGVEMVSKKKRIVHPNNNPFGGGASTKDRKAAKLAARRGVSRRVVRVAMGWKIEETAAGLKRRSPDTWRTYDAAELAMDDGYQMPALPVVKLAPTMMITDFLRYHTPNKDCFLCASIGETRRALYSMQVRIDGRKTACFAICDNTYHDLAIHDRINDQFEKKELGQ